MKNGLATPWRKWARVPSRHRDARRLRTVRTTGRERPWSSCSAVGAAGPGPQTSVRVVDAQNDLGRPGAGDEPVEVLADSGAARLNHVDPSGAAVGRGGNGRTAAIRGRVPHPAVDLHPAVGAGVTRSSRSVRRAVWRGLPWRAESHTAVRRAPRLRPSSAVIGSRCSCVGPVMGRSRNSDRTG